MSSSDICNRHKKKKKKRLAELYKEMEQKLHHSLHWGSGTDAAACQLHAASSGKASAGQTRCCHASQLGKNYCKRQERSIMLSEGNCRRNANLIYRHWVAFKICHHLLRAVPGLLMSSFPVQKASSPFWFIRTKTCLPSLDGSPSSARHNQNTSASFAMVYWFFFPVSLSLGNWLH